MHAGDPTASARGASRIAEGTSSPALATSFIHFDDLMSVEISTSPAWRST
ncbi:hypothetical protein [Nocardioides sp.]